MLLGHTCVCAVEINKYCRRSLLQRQRDGILPRFPIWDDINTFDGKPWRGIAQVICGGFPCQDISAANPNATGIDGARSGLWKQMARVVGEVRPDYIFVENSPMLISRGLGTVLGDISEMGYDAEWGVLGASDIGGQHQRKRIWILAHSHRLGRKRRSSPESPGEGWKRIFPEGLVVKPGPWEIEAREKARILGVGNGVAHGMDRIRAAGNGQVPLVAATAWQMLMEELTTEASL